MVCGIGDGNGDGIGSSETISFATSFLSSRSSGLGVDLEPLRDDCIAL